MKEEKESPVQIEEKNNQEIELEQKLGELLLRGWIMTTDSCPIESITI